MKVWAAIDVRDGAAVQLVGGDPSDERVRVQDPAGVARGWLAAGFRHIHVVDLDAALGDGGNDDAIAAIAAVIREVDFAGATLQVGGGLRDDDAVSRAMELGADRVIVGTRAVEDRPWLEAAADRHGGRLVVAADVRDREVVSRGWTEGTGHDAAGFLAGLDPLPLAGVLVTDVGREGREAGIDGGLFTDLVAATRHPVMAAGGVTTKTDLETLKNAGAAGAVLGMALYTGRLEPAVALEAEDG